MRRGLLWHYLIRSNSAKISISISTHSQKQSGLLVERVVRLNIGDAVFLETLIRAFGWIVSEVEKSRSKHTKNIVLIFRGQVKEENQYENNNNYISNV